MAMTRRGVMAGIAAVSAAPCGRASAQSNRIRHLAYSDQGGRPDSMQMMVSRCHLFVGHTFSSGFTVLDVADPTRPKLVVYLAAPPNTRTHHLQTSGDLIAVLRRVHRIRLGSRSPWPSSTG